MSSIEELFQSYGIDIIIAWVLSTVIFATLIIYISKHPHKRTMPLKAMFIFMFFGGMAIYCILNYWKLSLAFDKTTKQIEDGLHRFIFPTQSLER